MSERSNEDVVHAYLHALTERDTDAMAQLRDPGVTVEYPQSGELMRGHANIRAIDDNYPGGMPEFDPGRIVGSEDRWVVTPSFSFQRIAGSGDTWWAEGKVRYPDGSIWYVATMFQIRSGRIFREVTYWAEPFDPPAWRAPWVERIEEH